MDADRENRPDGEERAQEVRAAVAEERERHALRRQRLADHAEVEHRLEEDDERHADDEVAAEAVRRLARDVDGVGEERGEEDEDADREEDAELLRADGEDEVRMRLGQVVVLLHRLAEARAPESAVLDGDERLLDLIGRALRRRVEHDGRTVRAAAAAKERRETRHAVCVHRDLRRNDGEAAEEKRQEVQDARTGDEHHQEARRADDHYRTEVRLKENRQRHQRNQQRGVEGAAAEQLDAPARAVEQHREQDHRRELRELARLQAQRAEGDPAVRAVDGLEAEHRPEQKEHDGEERDRERRVVAPVAVVEPRHARREDDADGEVGELALHEEVDVAMQTERVRLARARQNDKAQRHEHRDHQAESE